jgi:hypothetical protein
MAALHEIRADFDRDTVVIYQAYDDRIADAALAHGRFVGPRFSFSRMTWIKPSLLWLMHRSHWGTRKGQERTLAVRITRAGFDRALSVAVSTDPGSRAFDSAASWRAAFDTALVHAQWDTERSITGAALGHYSVQLGLSRRIITEYVNHWIVGIVDLTERVEKLRGFVHAHRTDRARALLPPERAYPVDDDVMRRLR